MIISAKKIITGDGETVQNDYAVLIGKDGRIKETAPSSVLKEKYPEENVKDYPDCTLLPGLIDLHVHLGHFGMIKESALHNDYMMAYIAKEHAQKAFARGVTTLREVGSPEKVAMTLKAAADRGMFKIPRMQYTGAALCITGGHGTAYGLGEAVEVTNGTDAVRAAIRERVKHGSKWVKLMTSHRSNVSEYSQEELDAAADECHRLGIKVMAHSGTQPSIGMCIQAGFDSIEHGTFVTPEQIQEMKEKHIAWTPTILPYTTIYQMMRQKFPCSKTAPPEYFYCKDAADRYKDHFKEYYDMGVLVGAGTDNVTMEGISDAYIAKELQYMVEYGLHPLKAIQTATQNGAEILGMEQEIGLIKEGLYADLLIVKGNPDEQIDDLENIVDVYQSGEIVYKNVKNC